MNHQLKNECELTGEELKKVSSGIVDKDGASMDTRLRCTNCGAHGTLVTDK